MNCTTELTYHHPRLGLLHFTYQRYFKWLLMSTYINNFLEYIFTFINVFSIIANFLKYVFIFIENFFRYVLTGSPGPLLASASSLGLLLSHFLPLLHTLFPSSFCTALPCLLSFSSVSETIITWYTIIWNNYMHIIIWNHCSQCITI